MPRRVPRRWCTATGAVGPRAELYFIVGADSLADLASWKEPARILELSHLVAVPRPGHPVLEPHGLDIPAERLRERLITLRGPGVDVSSTDLRARVRDGLPIRYLVPDAVERYIEEQGLYASQG